MGEAIKGIPGVFNGPIRQGESFERGSSDRADAERPSSEAAKRLGPAKVLSIEESVRRRAEAME